MTRPNFEARLKDAALNFAANQAMTSATDSRVGFRAGARWAHDEARTVTAEQVEAAARAIYISDRADTLPDGFAERSWDLGLAAERDQCLRRARVALEAAGFTVPEEEEA